MSLSLTGAVTLMSTALALVKKVSSLVGNKLRVTRMQEKDAEIDAQGDVDEKELRKRFRG